MSNDRPLCFSLSLEDPEQLPEATFVTLSLSRGATYWDSRAGRILLKEDLGLIAKVSEAVDKETMVVMLTAELEERRMKREGAFRRARSMERSCAIDREESTVLRAKVRKLLRGNAERKEKRKMKRAKKVLAVQAEAEAEEQVVHDAFTAFARALSPANEWLGGVAAQAALAAFADALYPEVITNGWYPDAQSPNLDGVISDMDGNPKE